ncbi:unnamed protein product [Calypogeia fissa]
MGRDRRVGLEKRRGAHRDWGDWGSQEVEEEHIEIGLEATRSWDRERLGGEVPIWDGAIQEEGKYFSHYGSPDGQGYGGGIREHWPHGFLKAAIVIPPAKIANLCMDIEKGVQIRPEGVHLMAFGVTISFADCGEVLRLPSQDLGFAPTASPDFLSSEKVAEWTIPMEAGKAPTGGRVSTSAFKREPVKQFGIKILERILLCHSPNAFSRADLAIIEDIKREAEGRYKNPLSNKRKAGSNEVTLRRNNKRNAGSKSLSKKSPTPDQAHDGQAHEGNRDATRDPNMDDGRHSMDDGRDATRDDTERETARYNGQAHAGERDAATNGQAHADEGDAASDETQTNDANEGDETNERDAANQTNDKGQAEVDERDGEVDERDAASEKGPSNQHPRRAQEEVLHSQWQEVPEAREAHGELALSLAHGERVPKELTGRRTEPERQPGEKEREPERVAEELTERQRAEQGSKELSNIEPGQLDVIIQEEVVKMVTEMPDEEFWQYDEGYEFTPRRRAHRLSMDTPRRWKRQGKVLRTWTTLNTYKEYLRKAEAQVAALEASREEDLKKAELQAAALEASREAGDREAARLQAHIASLEDSLKARELEVASLEARFNARELEVASLEASLKAEKREAAKLKGYIAVHEARLKVPERRVPLEAIKTAVAMYVKRYMNSSS